MDNEKELREYKVEQLRFRRKHRHNKVDVADEELKALEKLGKGRTEIQAGGQLRSA